MNFVQAIEEHVAKFPPEKQAEVLDFVLFLEKNLSLPNHTASTVSAIDRLFGSYTAHLSSSEEFAEFKQREIEQEEGKW